MLRNLTDQQLATAFRTARNNARPLFCELARRGFVVSEKHGHRRVPCDTFENIIITRAEKETKL